MNESSKNTFLPGDIILKLPLNAVYWGRKHIVSRAEWICRFSFFTDVENWTLGNLVEVSRDEALEATNFNLRTIEIIEENKFVLIIVCQSNALRQRLGKRQCHQ